MSRILEGSRNGNSGFPGLLVGNSENDDAAVFDLGDGTAVVSTTDFFMPIVDDAFDFGRIASVNAISDIYAMGGVPMVAIAILGWPIDKVPESVAAKVIQGARAACEEAGIPLGGGHSIDSPEPIFGLAVTGRVEVDKIKRNNGAKPGDILYLTKPLGVGILTTAVKQGKLRIEHVGLATGSMVRLNKVGSILGEVNAVHAMTDVTGFGLGGHLIEMCSGSEVGAEIRLNRLPLLEPEAIPAYVSEGCVPGGTGRNFSSYGEELDTLSASERAIVCDPQTSGGLLLAVDPDGASAVEKLLVENGLFSEPIGQVTGPSHPRVRFIRDYGKWPD